MQNNEPHASAGQSKSQAETAGGASSQRLGSPSEGGSTR